MEKQVGNKMQVDVWLKAGDQTDAIPAHKHVLVTRSKVFKNILESDFSKETITLPEMTHNGLKTFLEFMYKGSLPHTKLKEHILVLYSSAYKYDIPDLQDVCRNKLVFHMNSKNVLDILKLAEIHADKMLQYEVSCWKDFYEV